MTTKAEWRARAIWAERRLDIERAKQPAAHVQPRSVIDAQPVTQAVIAQAEARLRAENFPDRGGHKLIAIDRATKALLPTAEGPPEAA